MKSIRWKFVAFWVTMFLFWYTFPTEGQVASVPHFKSGVVKKMPKPPPPITIDVMPRFVIPNPFKRQTFRVRWRIEPHDDNTSFRYEADCTSGDAHSSERATDQITWEIYPEMKGGPCIFSICVFRTNKKKICASQTVQSP